RDLRVPPPRGRPPPRRKDPARAPDAGAGLPGPAGGRAAAPARRNRVIPGRPALALAIVAVLAAAAPALAGPRVQGITSGCTLELPDGWIVLEGVETP